MIKISIKNITSTFTDLNLKREKLENTYLMKESYKLLLHLKTVTPIDTGEARAGWIIKRGYKHFILSNSVPYLKYLNEGSSQQAPSHFIESTALKYGRPRGMIVTSRD